MKYPLRFVTQIHILAPRFRHKNYSPFSCLLGPVGSTGAIGPQGLPGPKGEKGKGLSGVKYVRWGKTNCSGDATTVYSGKGGRLHI